jgi:hypothetical protein
MKETKVRGLLAEGEKTVPECLIDLEKSIMAETPITKKDKKGMRASEAELAKVDFIKKHFSKIEHKLAKDFDSTVFFATHDSIKDKGENSSEMDRLKKIIDDQRALLRIAFKIEYSKVYKAASDAADADTSLEFIYNSLKECYEKTSKSDSHDNTKDKGSDNSPTETAK